VRAWFGTTRTLQSRDQSITGHESTNIHVSLNCSVQPEVGQFVQRILRNGSYKKHVNYFLKEKYRYCKQRCYET